MKTVSSLILSVLMLASVNASADGNNLKPSYKGSVSFRGTAVVEAGMLAKTVIMLPAGDSYINGFTDGGTMSCVAVAPIVTDLPNGRTIGGQLATDHCSFKVHMRAAGVIVLVVENDDATLPDSNGKVEGPEHTYHIVISN